MRHKNIALRLWKYRCSKGIYRRIDWMNVIVMQIICIVPIFWIFSFWNNLKYVDYLKWLFACIKYYEGWGIENVIIFYIHLFLVFCCCCSCFFCCIATLFEYLQKFLYFVLQLRTFRCRNDCGVCFRTFFYWFMIMFWRYWNVL